jgi:transposase InsO family protein
MLQMARNATDESSGFLRGQRYLLHDRDTKFCPAFLDVLRSSGVRPLALPLRSPNLNAFAERWVSSVRQECLSKLILFGEASLRRALTEYIGHYHFERNHQGKGNLLLFPSMNATPKCRIVYRRDRLGGLLKFYSRVA